MSIRLGELVVAQNESKQVSVPTGAGQGSQRFERLLFSGATRIKGKVLPEGKYLGGLQAYHLSLPAERQPRLRAMTKAWMQMGRFWVCNCSIRFKRLVCAARVQGQPSQ